MEIVLCCRDKRKIVGKKAGAFGPSSCFIEIYIMERGWPKRRCEGWPPSFAAS
jgi:hypothetical protein